MHEFENDPAKNVLLIGIRSHLGITTLLGAEIVNQNQKSDIFMTRELILTGDCCWQSQKERNSLSLFSQLD